VQSFPLTLNGLRIGRSSIAEERDRSVAGVVEVDRGGLEVTGLGRAHSLVDKPFGKAPPSLRVWSIYGVLQTPDTISNIAYMIPSPLISTR
jgi:hypothetical protein